MLLTGRMVFSDYTKKRILFYHAKGSHARSHHTHARSHHAHAQSHTSLRVLFCPCSFRLSRSTALQVMASTLDRAQLLDYRREVLFEIRDRYMHCTRIKFNCNTHVVRIRKTERTVHGPFSVRAWSIQSPFNSRLTSVFIKRSSVKRTVHGRFFLAHTVGATAFDFERFRHLPYMDISSSGESPFVVAAHTCKTSATYCVSTCTERVLLFRARCEFAHS